jgi:broad specificity phosphatase PhoE
MSYDLRWILVRHGDTEWTEQNKLHGGRLDSPLSAKGRNQAERTGRALKDENVNAIYSSPQGRAIQTAEIIGEIIGIEHIQPVDGLRELNFGLLEGGPIPTFGRDGKHPIWLKPVADLARYLTGESKRHFTSRIAQAVSLIKENQGEGTVLVVSHWGALSVLMNVLFGGDPKYWLEEVKWSACGITKIKRTEDGWSVLVQDSVDHLEEIEI